MRHEYIKELKDYAKSVYPTTIVFSEGDYKLVQQAAAYLEDNHLAKTILTNSLEEAVDMLKDKRADVLIGGADTESTTMLKYLIKNLDIDPQYKRISSSMVMVLPNTTLYLADTSVNISPSKEQLKEIELQTRETAKLMGDYTNSAFLGYKTDGDTIQADVALNPEIAKRKLPGYNSPANVLIFPDLASGNIASKIIRNTTESYAIGPIVQGFKQHVGGLSRGSSLDDIVNTGLFMIKYQSKKNV